MAKTQAINIRKSLSVPFLSFWDLLWVIGFHGNLEAGESCVTIMPSYQADASLPRWSHVC